MSAEISPCGQYRYTLTRPATIMYPEKGSAVFCMLNPSTADATLDDPTIRRCRGFASRWGCNGIIVVNLYALRATDPRTLRDHPDPAGPMNDYWLRQITRDCRDIVCAWGTNADSRRVNEVVSMLRAQGAALWCLGVTKGGHPKHPLYIRADQPLISFEPMETS